MRYVDILGPEEPIGSYNPPNSIGESFWLKVTAYVMTTPTCYDEPKVAALWCLMNVKCMLLFSI